MTTPTFDITADSRCGERGDIAHTERSALDPMVQPLQDLLDRIIFRRAGLSDAESAALEERLAKML